MSTSLEIAELESLDDQPSPESGPQVADLVAVIKRWWMPWTLFVGVVTVGAVIVSLLLPARYTAVASIMSVGTGMPQGALGRLARIANIVPTRDELPAETLTTILYSRRLSEAVLDTPFQCHPDDERVMPLRNWLTDTEPGEEPSGDTVFRGLRRVFKCRIDPETRIVRLNAETRYPHLSAEIVEEFIHRLGRYATDEHQSKSRIVRQFMGARMAEVEEELEASENALRDFYSVNMNYARTSDPDIQIERLRFERVVEMKSRVMIELASQYEAAMIEERNDAPMVQIIDDPRVPDLRSWPKRGSMVGIAFVLSSLAGVAGVLVADSRARRRQVVPEQYEASPLHEPVEKIA